MTEASPCQPPPAPRLPSVTPRIFGAKAEPKGTRTTNMVTKRNPLEMPSFRTRGGGRASARVKGWSLAGALLACATAGRGAPSESPLTLVRNGEPAAIIVTADQPSHAAAAGAKLLEDVLFRMSGAHLRVVREGELAGAKVEGGRVLASGEGAAPAYVLVGEGEVAKQLGATSEGLGAGGIRIRTFANALALLGPDAKTPSDSMGTHYAVTTFLDETLGCKYLWPTESGLVVPSRKTVEVPALHLQATPRLQQRIIRPMGWGDRVQKGLDSLSVTKEDFLHAMGTPNPNWFTWHRMGGALGLTGGDGTILSPEAWARFQAEHPEWFAMQADGSREQAPKESRPRLCKSNPDLVAAIAQEKIGELKANPGKKCLSLTTHDGGSTGFCLCAACKAMDPKEGRPVKFFTYDHATRKVEWLDYVSLTDRMFSFYNAIAEKVAREFPDVLFAGQAYSIYSAPPLRTRLHPNIVIRYVGPSLYYRDTLRKEGLADWDAWTKAASKIFFRPNLLLTGRRQGTPMVYVHKLAEDFRHMVRTGMVGTDFDACIHNWATLGLNYYILAKLHWNPDLDVDRAIEDYCRAGFGDGWTDVRQYLARLEQLTDLIASKELEVTEPYTPKVIAELRGRLDAAEKAAGADAAVRRRLALLRRGLDFTDVQARAYRLLAELKTPPASPEDKEPRYRPPTPEEKAEAAQLLDRRWRMMRRMLREEPYAVNVGYVSWSEGRPFEPLGWTGPSATAKGEIEADEMGRPLEVGK